MIQTDLLKLTPVQQFELWRETPGGKHVLKHAYRLTAGYANRYLRTKQRVSVQLVWELLRDRVKWIRAGLKRRKIKLDKFDGFTLNNSFTAYVARHIIDHRPEWKGLFELREVGVVRQKRKVVVITEPTGNKGAD